jgi:hypothetical protein
MKLRTWLLAVLLYSHQAWADDSSVFLPPSEEIKALHGLEYVNAMPEQQRVASHLSCIDEGGALIFENGVLHRDWAKGVIQCQGQWVVALQRKVGMVGRHIKWRIVDTLVLPPISFDPDRSNAEALELVAEDHCEVKGLPNTTFIALVRFGKRQRIDWRTGVEKAWTFDIKRGRIVPLSTKRVVCEPYEP